VTTQGGLIVLVPALETQREHVRKISPTAQTQIPRTPSVSIVNIELNENMEVACPMSIPSSSAQRTSRIGRSGVVGPQISSCTSIGERRAATPTRCPAAFSEAAKLTPVDRCLWAWLSQVWNDWRSSLLIVQPETVIAWHRKSFLLFWPWKVQHALPGRPPVSMEIRQLIRKMSRENPLWGAPRIHGELLKLGIDVAETSVSKYMVRHRRPPSQTWRTFLENHVCMAN
jgi:hypothetical protein